MTTSCAATARTRPATGATSGCTSSTLSAAATATRVTSTVWGGHPVDVRHRERRPMDADQRAHVRVAREVEDVRVRERHAGVQPEGDAVGAPGVPRPGQVQRGADDHREPAAGDGDEPRHPPRPQHPAHARGRAPQHPDEQEREGGTDDDRLAVDRERRARCDQGNEGDTDQQCAHEHQDEAPHPSQHGADVT